MAEKIKICVAEDNELLQKYFVDLLMHEPGFTIVATAKSGREIVEIADQFPCDVILMDVEMDERRDGIDATRTIMANHSEIRIIILTIHEDIETIFEAFEAGAVDFILKNSSASTIIKSIHEAYANQSSLEPKVAGIIRNNITTIKRMRKNINEIITIVSSLTKSEKNLIPCILENKSLREIANENFIELPTVKFHISNMLRKFGVRRRKEIALIIREMGLEDLFK